MNETYACARAAYFQPTFSKYNNTVVPGVQWLSPQQYSQSNSDNTPGFTSTKPFYTATFILRTILSLAQPNDAFQWDGSWFNHPGTELIDDYVGNTLYREFIHNYTMTVEDIYNYFASESEKFKEMRVPYLLYK